MFGYGTEPDNCRKLDSSIPAGYSARGAMDKMQRGIELVLEKLLICLKSVTQDA
jgi:hypothetical protein